MWDLGITTLHHAATVTLTFVCRTPRSQHWNLQRFNHALLLAEAWLHIWHAWCMHNRVVKWNCVRPTLLPNLVCCLFHHAGCAWSMNVQAPLSSFCRLVFGRHSSGLGSINGLSCSTFGEGFAFYIICYKTTNVFIEFCVCCSSCWSMHLWVYASGLQTVVQYNNSSRQCHAVVWIPCRWWWLYSCAAWNDINAPGGSWRFNASHLGCSWNTGIKVGAANVKQQQMGQQHSQLEAWIQL